MTKLKLNPLHRSAVVAGFEDFVEKIELDKYLGFKPNRGRVIVKKFEDKPQENKSEGGIVLSGESEDTMEIGVVVSVGSGLLTQSGVETDLGFLPGDIVYIPEHFGHNFMYGKDRESLLSILASDIIGKLEE